MCIDCRFVGRSLNGPIWSHEWVRSVEEARGAHRQEMPTAWDRVLAEVIP